MEWFHFNMWFQTSQVRSNGVVSLQRGFSKFERYGYLVILRYR